MVILSSFVVFGIFLIFLTIIFTNTIINQILIYKISLVIIIAKIFDFFRLTKYFDKEKSISNQKFGLR